MLIISAAVALAALPAETDAQACHVIVRSYGSGWEQVGSGVCVATAPGWTWILTCRHVVLDETTGRDAARILVSGSVGRDVAAYVAATSQPDDLAVIAVKRGPVRKIARLPPPLYRSDTTDRVLIGNQLDRGPWYRTAQRLNRAWFSESGALGWTFTPYVKSGDSGGPVWDSQYLIGIISVSDERSGMYVSLADSPFVQSYFHGVKMRRVYDRRQTKPQPRDCRT